MSDEADYHLLRWLLLAAVLCEDLLLEQIGAFGDPGCHVVTRAPGSLPHIWLTIIGANVRLVFAPRHDA